MRNIPVYDAGGKEVRSFQIDESIFGERVLTRTLKEVVIAYERNRRQGTHDVKARGEVAGSNRKLWKQKGTGRARVGDRRPPHRRGGGIAHGPTPKEYRKRIPANLRRAALNSALLSKLLDGEMKAVEGMSFTKGPKTAQVAKFLAATKARGGTLFALTARNDNFYKSIRNIPRVAVRTLADLNAWDIMRHGNLVLDVAALEALSKGSSTKPAAEAKE